MIIRQMTCDEIDKIAGIDRTEHVTLGYKSIDGQLVAEKVDWHIPRWQPEGAAHHSVAVRVKTWSQLVDEGGVALGAFDGDRLAGIAILRYRLTETMAQLAVLFVSKDYRRMGVATELVARVFDMAKASGATQIYVSATPSESAVGFYMSHGFKPTKDVNKELFEMEPEDIHMLKEL